MNERLVVAVLLVMACAPSQAAREQPLSPSAPSMPAPASPVLLSEQMADLSLLDAVFLGLRNNRSIKSAYLWRIADKFDLRVAEDAFSPKLYLSSSYRAARGHDDRERSAQLGATTTLLGEYGTRISLGWNKYHSEADMAGWRRNDGVDFSIIQPLLRGGGREVTTAPLRLARLTEQANRLGLKASIAQTVSAIIYAYRDLLRAQEQLRIAKAALQRSRELLEVNRAMIQAGRMAEFDAVQTEASLASQELGVEEAANLVDTSRLELLRLLALDLSSPVRATDTLQAEAIEIDPEQAIRLAEHQQPDYLRQLIQRQQADINLLLAKDQSKWDLSVEIGASQARDRYGSPYDNGAQRSWDSYAGLRLDIPIGDLSRRQGEVSARVNVEDQQLQLEEARQALIRNVKDVVRDLGTRWRQYEIAQRGVELSQRKLAIERDKLAAGRSSNFQVLSFENDLQSAENARLNALIAYLNAQTQLDLTLGMTLESWEIIINDH
ncbi:TolC family protein [Pseudomonas sp. AA-38]|uniref:TolC family protein n=1 Tax=Pseudomonas sp. AA-38 TaxID=3028807 RepID=UPI0023F934CA|nr:TolC family protein [Pseudomonas sp. AA-38]